MSKYQYGVELYSVEKELARDMPGTLKKVSAMGYEGVEFCGDIVYTADEVKKALAEAGLVCCSWHTEWRDVQDDRIDDTVAFFKAIGNSNVIIAGLPKKMMATKEDVIHSAGLMNRVAARLAPYGLSLGYHNHAGELRPYQEGSLECPFTVFFDHTDPSIIVQMDNGHVLNGRGIDMLTLIRRYPGRYKTVHIKPYSLKKGAEEHRLGYYSMIGEDDVPWSEFMPLCKTVGGTQWYIVEYEIRALHPELEGVELCMKALKAMEERNEI